jgi:hypothetical protein
MKQDFEQEWVNEWKFLSNEQNGWNKILNKHQK